MKLTYADLGYVPDENDLFLEDLTEQGCAPSDTEAMKKLMALKKKQADDKAREEMRPFSKMSKEMIPLKEGVNMLRNELVKQLEMAVKRYENLDNRWDPNEGYNFTEEEHDEWRFTEGEIKAYKTALKLFDTYAMDGHE